MPVTTAFGPERLRGLSEADGNARSDARENTIRETWDGIRFEDDAWNSVKPRGEHHRARSVAADAESDVEPMAANNFFRVPQTCGKQSGIPQEFYSADAFEPGHANQFQGQSGLRDQPCLQSAFGSDDHDFSLPFWCTAQPFVRDGDCGKNVSASPAACNQ